MIKTDEVLLMLKDKYKQGIFRVTKSGVKTVELQNIQFEADKDWIVREPNYDYAAREINWYKSMSKNVYDIEGKVPEIWKQCADVNGNINSNYGWMIWSPENGSQYKNCLWLLVNDPVTREAVMIYNRPSMHVDATANHMHDFCCTYAAQCFLNPLEGKEGYSLNYIVYQRSMDAVFGYDNDITWHLYVQACLQKDLKEKLNVDIEIEPIKYHSGSIHVYERHFKFLED